MRPARSSPNGGPKRFLPVFEEFVTVSVTFSLLQCTQPTMAYIYKRVFLLRIGEQMGENRSRIKVSFLFVFFIIILAAFAVLLLIGSSKVEKTVTEMQETNNEYIAGQNSIDMMREVSDYLTSECRTFIMTGDIENAREYFKEVQIDKRREKALTEVEQFGKDSTIYTSLQDALVSSDDLSKTEYYAMRLASEGYDINPALISADLAEVKLSAADKELSPEKQLSKARDLVFNDAYQEAKATIYNDVYGSMDDLLQNTRSHEIDSYHEVQKLVNRQNIVLLIIMVISVAMLIITALLVIVPLRNSTSFIREHKKLPVKGAAEYAYLAESYNKMLETTQERHENLSYEATHDELTKLYNRKFFEMKRTELADEDTAMIIADVDYFKQINDNYGHEVGDMVLKKVSQTLESSFRSEDFVCRVGGDEFVIMMVQMRPELKHVIEDKILHVREVLKEDKVLPAVSLSIGIAFSSDVNTITNVSDGADVAAGDGGQEGAADASTIGHQDLFGKADLALYKSKADGRNRYTFYSDAVSI